MRIIFISFIIAMSFIVSGCFNKIKITKITLKDSPMIEVCFNESLQNYYGTFMITTKNNVVISNKDKEEVIINTVWGKGYENKCDEFNPFNSLTNRWTTNKEFDFLHKNLKWSNIKSITFILYKKDSTGIRDIIDEFTQNF